MNNSIPFFQINPTLKNEGIIEGAGYKIRLSPKNQNESIIKSSSFISPTRNANNNSPQSSPQFSNTDIEIGEEKIDKYFLRSNVQQSITELANLVRGIKKPVIEIDIKTSYDDKFNNIKMRYIRPIDNFFDQSEKKIKENKSAYKQLFDQKEFQEKLKKIKDNKTNFKNYENSKTEIEKNSQTSSINILESNPKSQQIDQLWEILSDENSIKIQNQNWQFLHDNYDEIVTFLVTLNEKKVKKDLYEYYDFEAIKDTIERMNKDLENRVSPFVGIHKNSSIFFTKIHSILLLKNMPLFNKLGNWYSPDDNIVSFSMELGVQVRIIKTLQKSAWLANQVINAYARFLRHQSLLFIQNGEFAQSYNFDTNFAAATLNNNSLKEEDFIRAGIRELGYVEELFSKSNTNQGAGGAGISIFEMIDRIGFPINVNENHWIFMGIYNDPEVRNGKIIVIYDSQRCQGDQTQDKYFSLMSLLIVKRDSKYRVTKCINAQCPEQENGSDCGVFVCQNMCLLNASSQIVGVKDYNQNDMYLFRKLLYYLLACLPSTSQDFATYFIDFGMFDFFDGNQSQKNYELFEQVETLFDDQDQDYFYELP